MKETLPHNTTTKIAYMHKSIHESSTNAILLMYTHLTLTYFLKSVISFTSSHWQMWEGVGSGVMPWGLTHTFPQQQYEQ